MSSDICARADTRRPNATVSALVVAHVGKTKMIATNLKLDNDQIRQTMQSPLYLAAFLGQHNKGCKWGSDAEMALDKNLGQLFIWRAPGPVVSGVAIKIIKNNTSLLNRSVVGLI